MLKMIRAPLLFKYWQRIADEIFRVSRIRIILRRNNEYPAWSNTSQQIIEIKVFSKARNDKRHLQGCPGRQFMPVGTRRSAGAGKGDPGIQRCQKKGDGPS